MSLAEIVRYHRTRLGMTQQKLTQAVKAKGGTVGQSTISDIEKGRTRNPRCLPELAEIFDVTEKDMRKWASAGLQAMVRELPPPVEGFIPALHTETGDNAVAKVVVFRGRRAESGLGGWVIYPDRATGGAVELAPSLIQGPRIFKVEVLDEQNSPKFEPRDILDCDPDREPIHGNYCVFVGGKDINGGIPALLGKLISATKDEWLVKPHAAAQFALARSLWAYAWVVVSHHLSV